MNYSDFGSREAERSRLFRALTEICLVFEVDLRFQGCNKAAS